MVFLSRRPAMVAALLLASVAGPAEVKAEAEVEAEAVEEDEAVAVKAEAGRPYAAGTRVLLPALGVSLVIPDEWKGEMAPTGGAFVMGSDTHRDIGLVFGRAEATAASLAGEMAGPQDLGDGVVLEPAAPPAAEGSRVGASYAGAGFSGRAEALVAPQGHAVIAFFAGPEDEAPYRDRLLTELVASVRFSAPDVSGFVAQWQALLAGMMLKQLESYSSYGGSGAVGGYSRSATWHLCRDGSFTYSFSSSASVDADGTSGYGRRVEQQSGRWLVEIRGPQAFLVLEASEGSRSEHVLEYDGEKTFLDGERVSRVPSDACP